MKSEDALKILKSAWKNASDEERQAFIDFCVDDLAEPDEVRAEKTRNQIREWLKRD